MEMVQVIVSEKESYDEFGNDVVAVDYVDDY